MALAAEAGARLHRVQLIHSEIYFSGARKEKSLNFAAIAHDPPPPLTRAPCADAKGGRSRCCPAPWN